MKKTVISLIILCLVILIGIKINHFDKFLPAQATEKTLPKSIDWTKITIDKVEVYKAQRELKILQNGQVIKIYKMRLGFSPIGHKTTEGDGKTPEGRYILDWRNANSQFYKSLHISYPNQQDIAQAKKRGVSAGGDIMIHGSSKNLGGKSGEILYEYMPQKDWTWGCIAVSNRDMDELWKNVKNGTTIEIFP